MFLASTFVFFSPLVDFQWLCFMQDYLPKSWDHNAALRSSRTTVLDNALRKCTVVSGRPSFMVFLLWIKHITALLPVLMAEPTVWSFICPGENGNAPGSEAAFQLVCTSCQEFFGWHPLYVSLSLYITFAHAIGCSQCGSALTHWPTDGTSFSLCSGVMFSDSVCLLIIIPAAPKSLYQHGGDTRDFWTASGGSKLFRVRSDRRVSERNRSSPLKAFVFCFCLFVWSDQSKLLLQYR